MTLFTSLNTALSALQSQMAALQTTGHNIANANTPGYTRQRVDFETMPPQDMVFAQLGKGVRVGRISRIVDEVLNEHLRGGSSALGNLQVRNQALTRLEGFFNELTDGDISTAMDDFFNAMQDFSQNPQDTSVRTALINQGKILADGFNFLSEKIHVGREQIDQEVKGAVGDINQITKEIAELNRSITGAENGGYDHDTANDLRDRRDLLLNQLSEMVQVKVIETSTGCANVLVGSNYIVFDNTAYEVKTTDKVNNGVLVSTPEFTATGINLELRAGKLKGLIDSRDDVLQGYSNDLNTLARSIAFELNKVHSGGVGLQRLSSIESVYAVSRESVSSTTGAPIATQGRVSNFVDSNTIIDSSLVGYANDFFEGLEVMMTSGANAGQRRRIVDFGGTLGAVGLDKPFDKPIGIGDTYQITSLYYPVKNGSFNINLTNELTGQATTYNISIDLDKIPIPPAGPGRDSTLESIRDEINAELPPQVRASITSTNRLKIESSAPNLTFSFSDDTSDFLASMGINTFFTGTDASDMAVNELISNSPRLLTAARSNNPGDNTNAQAMADLRTAMTLENGTASFEDFYQGIVGTLAADVAESSDRYETQKLISSQLENERERISGVSIDEEATNLITYQRAYQAAAKFASVIDQLLQTIIMQM
jgi:flagellar hook-associated protein 1 FlgK